jgi:hypothetical protein
MHTTRSVKREPYCSTAVRTASISLCRISCPEDAYSPSNIVVFVAMAAGMAEIGVLVVPSWILVKRRTELKQTGSDRARIARNSASKSDCCLIEPSAKAAPELKPLVDAEVVLARRITTQAAKEREKRIFEVERVRE